MRLPSEPQGSLRIVNRTPNDVFVSFRGGLATLCAGGQVVSVPVASTSRSLGDVSVSPALDGVALSPASQYRHDGKAGKLSSMNVEQGFQLFYSSTTSPTLIILARPDLASWMADVPDETPLGDLCMPGTHDSCALYGLAGDPISQCQQASTPPDLQLQSGVRFLDIRMKVVGDELRAYHGIRPQRSTFLAFISQLSTFLIANASETVIVLMKEEANGSDQDPRFSRILHENMQSQIQAGLWYLENRVPALGEVRGKAILMSRFDMKEGDGWVGEDGIGIHPSTWPDSARNGFEWQCADTTFRTQDWYRLSTFLDIPEKFETVKAHISPNAPRPAKSFTLSYTSAAGYPFALPTHIAKGFGWPGIGLGVEGVNVRLAQYLLECAAAGMKIKACFAMDFFSEIADVHEIIVAMNFLSADVSNKSG